MTSATATPAQGAGGHRAGGQGYGLVLFASILPQEPRRLAGQRPWLGVDSGGVPMGAEVDDDTHGDPSGEAADR